MRCWRHPPTCDRGASAAVESQLWLTIHCTLPSAASPWRCDLGSDVLHPAPPCPPEFEVTPRLCDLGSNVLGPVGSRPSKILLLSLSGTSSTAALWAIDMIHLHEFSLIYLCCPWPWFRCFASSWTTSIHLFYCLHRSEPFWDSVTLVLMFQIQLDHVHSSLLPSSPSGSSLRPWFRWSQRGPSDLGSDVFRSSWSAWSILSVPSGASVSCVETDRVCGREQQSAVSMFLWRFSAHCSATPSVAFDFGNRLVPACVTARRRCATHWGLAFVPATRRNAN